MTMRDVYSVITDTRALAWPADPADDPAPLLGSANSDQDPDLDFYFDPEEALNE